MAGPAVDLGLVRERVAAYRPRAKPGDHPSVWAATALIVAGDHNVPAVAFIQRATRVGDRWSGQMALPGGRRDRGDPDALTTAVREAHEEVGVRLPAPTGRLDDVRSRTHRGIVATYVFVLDDRPPLRPAAGEVAAALWIPLGTLLSAEAAVRHAGGIGRFAAIRHGEHVIWGLTHRIIGSFVRALSVELPPPA